MPSQQARRNSGWGRSVSHSRFPDEWLAAAAEFTLLRELIEYMTPLFMVAMGSASANNAHYVAVPPDSALEEYLLSERANAVDEASGSSLPHSTSSESDLVLITPPKGDVQIGRSVTRPRLLQAAVRSHIFRTQSGETALTSLGGHSASIQWNPTNSEGPDAADTATVLGSLHVRSPQGATMDANILRVLPSDNQNFTILFIDSSLHVLTPMARRSVASMKASGVMGHQPLWQRIPCTALKATVPKSDKGKKASTSTKQDTVAPVRLFSCSDLMSMFRGDEQSFRQFVVDLANERDDEVALARLSKASRVSSDDTRPSSKHFECDDTSYDPTLQLNMDRAMMFADTEASMFLAAYAIIPGYEGFIVSKVHQIIESATEISVGSCESTSGSEDDCDVATASSDTTAVSVWSEEDQEQLLVAFHTIVMGAIAPKVVPHWQSMYETEDFGFQHACNTLGSHPTALEEFSTASGIRYLSRDACTQSIEILSVLNSTSLSVFSYMRVMECATSCAIETLAKTLRSDAAAQESGARAAACEVSADVCIPLVVLILAYTSPAALLSRIRFILDFSIPVLEMSSLGYALTTFEAASEQLLEEYRSRIVLGCDE